MEDLLTAEYDTADDTVLTDALVNELAAEAERGFPPPELTYEPSPWQQRQPMETHSLRVPAQLWELLEQQAQQHNMSVSEYTRQTIARGLLARINDQDKGVA